MDGERVAVHYSALNAATEELRESTYQVAYPVIFFLNDGCVMGICKVTQRGCCRGGDISYHFSVAVAGMSFLL